MAKVVKFCTACEEGFAEKFGFCPNCGGALTAYELNPIASTAAEKSNGNGSAPPPAGKVEAKTPVVPVAPVVNESPAVVERKSEPVTAAFLAAEEDEILEINQEPKAPVASAAPAAATAAASNVFTQDFSPKATRQNGSSNGHQKTVANNPVRHDDGLYHITFVEEKNASGRNMLLLGAFLLVTTMALGGVVYSLFQRNLMIGSLGGDDSMLAYVGPVEPEPVVEDEPPPKKNNDEGGGGGGGGREEETETSKGRLAPQMRATPQIAPTHTIEQKNFELKYQATTVGDKFNKPTDEKYGNPNAAFGLKASDGTGTGGGQGSGVGTGQGSGRGTGQGSGIGSGSGNGNGNGNGDEDGDGDGGRNAPPPPPAKKPAGPPEPMRIIAKPRPSYTDAARQNQVTGVVRLKVTFLASGQIGSVTPVSGLSYGLTEQAIAAAKQIKFEPQKVGGVAQTVSKTIEYSFSIY